MLEWVILYQGKMEIFDNKPDAMSFILFLKSHDVPYRFLLQGKGSGLWREKCQN